MKYLFCQNRKKSDFEKYYIFLVYYLTLFISDNYIVNSY
jgi:hypothetical protein